MHHMHALTTGRKVTGWSPYLAVVIAAAVFGGCGSSRITVEGYEASDLNGKRLFVLLPGAEDLRLENPEAFAFSRGIGAAGAQGRFATELRSQGVSALDSRLDSNTVLDYATQPVGAMVSMRPSDDFAGAHSSSWNWQKVEQAARQGNVDYLLVLHEVGVNNRKPKEGEGSRGWERIDLSFSLIDAMRDTVMTANTVHVELSDPRVPEDSYQRLARELARRLPFHVRK